MQPIRIGDITLDETSAPLLIAGMCVIEDEEETLRLAEAIADLAAARGYAFVFKASYLKDNRSASASFRGPGLHEGLDVLQKIRTVVGCPILSDCHTVDEIEAAAGVLDVVQIPAFLSRQTRLLEAAGRLARAVNIKKGQFLSPEGAGLAVEKVRSVGGAHIMLTERGTTFGYNDLVVDFRGMAKMKAFGCPVIFDVTHSLQKPGGLGDRSGGEPELAAVMARAAAAIPCNGLFIETHFEPKRAKSDAASMIPFERLAGVLDGAAKVLEAVRS